MNTLLDTLRYFVVITLELAGLFIGISALVALILMYVPKEKLGSWLSRRGLLGNILGAVAGALTPFCACSTIPMTLGMLNAGAPFGAVMSFVIASPLLNPIIIVMIVSLMGWQACLVYFGVTFIGAVVFGLVLEKAGASALVKKVRLKPQDTDGHEVGVGAAVPFTGKVRSAFRTALTDFRAVARFLLVGVGIGALIYGYIPQDFVVRIAGPTNPFAIPIAATVGVPLYIRAETAIPIGLALSQKGMGMGAVIALIIGGAGMAIPEMAMLASIFKRKLVGAIILVIWLTAVIGGYLFNGLV